MFGWFGCLALLQLVFNLVVVTWVPSGLSARDVSMFDNIATEHRSKLAQYDSTAHSVLWNQLLCHNIHTLAEARPTPGVPRMSKKAIMNYNLLHSTTRY